MVIVIFLCILVGFLTVCGYGECHFWLIDVADRDVYGLLLCIRATCVSLLCVTAVHSRCLCNCCEVIQ